MRVEGYDGTFKRVRTVSRMLVRVNRHRVFKLMKAGNTKGDALLQVTTKIVGPSRKRVLISRRPICRGRGVGRRVFCVSSNKCFPRKCATTSLGSFCERCCPSFVASHCDGLVSRFRLSRGHEVDSCDGKVGGRLLIVVKVDTKAGCLLYSRAFSKLSPIVHRTMGDLFISRVVGQSFAPIVTSRGVERLRSIYSRMKFLRGKKVLLSERLRSVGFRVRGVRYMLPSRAGRRTLLGRLSILGGRRRKSLLVLATEKAERRVLRGMRARGPVFYRIVPLALRRVFVDRARITNCRIGGVF